MNAETLGRSTRAWELSARIATLLVNEDAETIGFVLADLTAMWLVAHDAGMREGLLDLQVATIRNLMRVNEKDLTEQTGDVAKIEPAE